MKRRIIILIMISCVFMSFFACGEKKINLPKNASWNEKYDKILEREKKYLDDTWIGWVSERDGYICYSGLTLYNTSGASMYYYFKKNKLNMIEIQYSWNGDWEEIEDSYSNVALGIGRAYGDCDSDSEKKNVTWTRKNAKIVLSYKTSGFINEYGEVLDDVGYADVLITPR